MYPNIGYYEVFSIISENTVLCQVIINGQAKSCDPQYK